MLRTIEQSTMRKVYLRILPFAVLTYFFCYLDRINVGFAALTMNKDIGLDAALYGMAAGAFFWGYVLFEVPSNIILEKVGARMWIARIMITWGLISGATALRPAPTASWRSASCSGWPKRGCSPVLCLYFTYWFPDPHRARINSGFTLALPIAVASGRAGLDRAAGARRAVGPAGVAVHVHPRGDPDGADRHRRVLLPDRPAERGALAQSPRSATG